MRVHALANESIRLMKIFPPWLLSSSGEFYLWIVLRHTSHSRLLSVIQDCQIDKALLDGVRVTVKLDADCTGKRFLHHLVIYSELTHRASGSWVHASAVIPGFGWVSELLIYLSTTIPLGQGSALGTC